jgi:hypothetical protein
MEKGLKRTYLGSWVLPSGNSCDVYMDRAGEMLCYWDAAPAWPRSDLDHWDAVTFPEILRAIARATGERALGIQI